MMPDSMELSNALNSRRCRVLRDLDHQLNKYPFVSLEESGPKIVAVLESSGYEDPLGFVEDLKVALRERDRRSFESLVQEIYLVIRGDHPYIMES